MRFAVFRRVVHAPLEAEEIWLSRTPRRGGLLRRALELGTGHIPALLFRNLFPVGCNHRATDRVNLDACAYIHKFVEEIPGFLPTPSAICPNHSAFLISGPEIARMKFFQPD